MTTPVLPPETLEGWYALHELYTVDHAALAMADAESRRGALDATAAELHAMAAPAEGGWSRVVPLVGSVADVMMVHLRPTLDDLLAVQHHARTLPVARWLRLQSAFLSVSEAGLYHLTAKLAAEAEARGGTPGDAAYEAALAEQSAAELGSAHVRRRLYPEPPDEMPYVSFYPMSKRRAPGQNWYALSLEERSRLMYTHGTTGRRYAGRVMQIISGAVGLAAWEWGVTLFAVDPLEFKRLVTDMRFDEVSAQYADFGDFHVGKVASPEAWTRSLGS